MTLARQRLLLGIGAVGATVLLAAIALHLDLPARLLSNDTSSPVATAVLDALAWPVLFTLLLFPLDLLGGVFAVRIRPRIVPWLAGWIRGVAVQLLVFSASGALLLVLSRRFGPAGTVVAAVIGSVVIFMWLDVLARLGARMHRHVNDPRAFDSSDEAFVGGFAGVLRPRLTLPASWFALRNDVRDALVDRRHLAAGAHRIRGLLAAVGWTAAGALVAATVLGAPESAASLVTFSIGCTLWSFLGVLLLPTPSRRAVFALDHAAAVRNGVDAVARGIGALDSWGDDEPRRTPLVETVFHPVPSRDARLMALAGSAPKPVGAWRAARLALPAGTASWSLLGRAVHCNIGRPALWWMLPGD